MLSENIKTLRKQKGYSQEMVAEKLNVVRQTVSKWEKGYSVPDAEMLERMAELFEVSVGDLLGKDAPEKQSTPDMEAVVQQLILLNDQLARQSQARRRTRKTVAIVLASVVGFVFVLAACGTILCAVLFGVNVVSQTDEERITYEVLCTLDGEEYMYTIICDEQFQILEAGGDAWIANHVQAEEYDDANVLLAQIEVYFEDRGGTCEIAQIVSSAQE